MRILLTGATGFLGSNLLPQLLHEGHEVVVTLRPTSDTWRINPLLDQVKVCQISDEESLIQLFRNKIDTIIHCATNYGRKMVDPLVLLDANLMFPLRLLHLGSTVGVRCFINTDTVLDKRVSHYSLSKVQFKEWLHHYAGSMTCINIALEHFYGPYDDPTKFVTFIIKNLLKKADYIDLTAGNQKRDFIFIDDVVSAFLHILNHSSLQNTGYLEYEIGTGKTIAIREFVELVKKLCNNVETELNFGAIPYRANEVMETAVDTNTVKAIGWEIHYTLEAGLRQTILIERDAE